ncbi:MAG TPA: ferritin-like domain-containing protein [Anaerolineales bacterium]|nr:ferritin-like domain-containing protein [Anaerolineales bacterium]
MLTSLEWKKYYEENAQSLLEIPWQIGHELTEDEEKAIASSIQDFQAGESSEGRHLFQYAKNYASETGDYEYVEAIRLFIAEEQRHARDLARFLQINGIPLVKTTFTDGVFRRLRQLLGNLEISIAVLITAEIIAKVYYLALRNATNSQVLQTLCKQILQDEVRHVEFQAERLGILRASRNWLLLTMTKGLQRFLFCGTCLVVWVFHRKVFVKSEYSFVEFWKQCWTEFNDAFQISRDVMEIAKNEHKLVMIEHNFDHG